MSTIVETTSLDYASPGNRAEPEFLGIPYPIWGRVGVLTALFTAVFWHNLVRLWLKTNPFTGEPNWSHSIVVPVIGLYYLFIHREDLLNARSHEFIWGPILRPGRAILGTCMLAIGAGLFYVFKSHDGGIAFTILRVLGQAVAVLGLLGLLLDWSLATTFFGLAVFVYGIYPGKNDYESDLGMIITLFGIVLLLCGRDVMKIAWFPIVFLVVALPWPGLVYSWVAEPLSILAAKVAVHTLQLTGVDSACQGTKIVIANSDPSLPPRILNVAEACAGMRSLMTFIAVAGAVAFLAARPLWQRIIIVASAIPIAIFCNVMRISGQGLLDHYVSQEWSESFAHQFVGMVMLAPAFALILFVAYVLDKMFIEEGDDDNRKPVRASTPTVAIAARPASIPAPIPATGSMAAMRSPATVAAPKPTQTPPRPALASTPPRPITAANPRPRIVPPAPANGTNGRTPPAPGRITAPASPLASPSASPVGSSAASPVGSSAGSPVGAPVPVIAGPRTSVNPTASRPPAAFLPPGVSPEVKSVANPGPTAPALKPTSGQSKEQT